MDLRGTLRSGVAAATMAAVAVPAGYASPAFAARAPLDVRVAQAKDFSRLEFHWTGGVGVTTRRDGQTLILRFSRDARPDIAALKVMPPRWLKGVEARHAGGGLEMVLTLADDAEAKVGQADGATFVNIFAKAAPPAGQVAETAPAPEPVRPNRPNPVPDNGVVAMASSVNGGQVKLRFDWKAPAGAAVFKRGAAVWIVFDAQARIDISKAPQGLAEVKSIQQISGPGFTALRIVSPRNTPVSAEADAASWTVTLGQGATPANGVSVQRDSESGAAALTATLAGASAPVWINDPAVGDRIAVVPALGPAKGLGSRRDYVDLALLPTAQGLAMEPYAVGLQIVSDGDLVRIGGSKALALSPAVTAQSVEDASMGAPQPASMPGLIGADWSKTGSGGFLHRYDALMKAAAEETGAGDVNSPKTSAMTARMALARFLVGSELSFEAIGVLNAAARDQSAIMGDGEFRGLRGVARVMAGRYKEAEADLSSPVLADDPSSSLWRGYVAGQQGQWADARAKFASGAQALNLMPPIWRARMLRMDAEAALALGDTGAADTQIAAALRETLPSDEQLACYLVQAKLREAQGDKGRALAIFTAISRAPLQQYATPALLHATQIRMDMGQITPAVAVSTFDGLRFRWRGDATELDTIRMLGALYLKQGRYREALETLRSAGTRLPDLPQAVALQGDLGSAFRALFLDGLADGLQPVQALALFRDFQELTPIGADGDLMVRKMVRRLVDVDLLDDAADLLKYQVDNRLDGVPKAQVATDLAMINLMNRKPEQALQAINESRTTLLPNALNAERRVITARALVGLGRLDAAQEIIDGDNSADALDVKAEIAWKGKQWAAAGGLLERTLGDRWKQILPLRPDEEAKLLRAGVAYSLAGDDAALGRLRTRYQSFFDAARNPDALRVAFTPTDGGSLTAADFSRAVADNEAFDGWVSKMKQRFRDKPAPLGPSPTRQASTGPSAG